MIFYGKQSQAASQSIRNVCKTMIVAAVYHITTAFLLNCVGAEIVQIPPLTEASKEYSKKHYNMIPEVVDKLVLLAEQDRTILKTILANHAWFYENLLSPIVLQSYNASHEAGNCAVIEERIGKQKIRSKRKLLEIKVDRKIADILEEWSQRQSEKELDEYYMGKFWPDREALYDYVSNKNKGVCEDPDDDMKCTGVGVLEREAAEVIEKIWICKAPSEQKRKYNVSINHPLHHFDLTLEATELLKNLVRLDRLAQKTITENQNTLFTTFLSGMIMESYNFSAGTSECAIAKTRALSQTLLKRMEIIDEKIDNHLDKMTQQWETLKSQVELEDYFVKFWEDRNTIYQYVTHRGNYKSCMADIEDESCLGLNAQLEVFGDIFKHLSDCKEKFWRDISTQT